MIFIYFDIWYLYKCINWALIFYVTETQLKSIDISTLETNKRHLSKLIA